MISLKYNLSTTTRVKKAINAPDIIWRGCIPGSGRRRLQQEHDQRVRQLYLQQDRPISMMPYIAELLDDARIQVLIIRRPRLEHMCRVVRCSSTVWYGVVPDEWTKAPKPLGRGMRQPYSKRHKGLEFVVVYNSGHLVL
jgi:hypothetical protein